jgi:hypothetical protein
MDHVTAVSGNGTQKQTKLYESPLKPKLALGGSHLLNCTRLVCWVAAVYPQRASEGRRRLSSLKLHILAHPPPSLKGISLLIISSQSARVNTPKP